MKTTTAILLVLALGLPSVARAHPCEAELAGMRKELESIRKAVTSIEAVPPGDTRDQMLTGAKARYDLEKRRIQEKQTLCDALVAAENPGAAPVPATAAAAGAPTGPAAVAAPAAAPAAPAAAVVVVGPVVESVTPVAPPQPPGAPCLTGCGKDTDCKGDRICVKGECIDPPVKKN